MEAIALNRIADKKAFHDAARAIGFDNFTLLKWLYILEQAEIDTLPVLGDDMLQILVYGWRIFQKYMDHQFQTVQSGTVVYFGKEQTMILRVLTQCTLDLWFSREWLSCGPECREGVLVCLSKSLPLLKILFEFAPFNWDYVAKLVDDPWDLPYWRRYSEDSTPAGQPVEDPICQLTACEIAEDIAMFKREGIYLVLLRLVKMFDAGSMEQVRNLSMRVMVACYHTYDETMKELAEKDVLYANQWKCCLLVACHMHLMAIYESDPSGSTMDMIMHNMRVFSSWQGPEGAHKPKVHSVACYVPLISRKVNLALNDFFYGFVTYRFRDTYRSKYGIVAQAYRSYILGNILVELNDTALLNGPDAFYHEVLRRTFDMYVAERENSDKCLNNEIKRQKRRRRRDRSTLAALQSLNDYKAKLNKGNLTHRHLEGSGPPSEEVFLEPIFQSMPKNLEVLKYVYGVLEERDYDGWKSAKIILLVKLISYEFNMIELWRYHPGLTTDFMLSLDVQLAKYMSALAVVCQRHALVEQELWLSSFCLHPIEEYYKQVVRCGVRNFRRGNSQGQGAHAPPSGRRTTHPDTVDTKFPLFSSVVDVNPHVDMTEYETARSDYDTLAEALQKLHLPDLLVMDLTTITFQSRNKMFTWTVPWSELRLRCRALLKHPLKKSTFVEMSMSESMDRLQYLNVDYEKYWDRPQMDYGFIEQGYEDALPEEAEDEQSVAEPAPARRSGKFDRWHYYEEDDEDDDDEEEDDHNDDSYDSSVRRSRRSHASLYEVKCEELSPDTFRNTVRTRARTAAIIEEHNRNKTESPPHGSQEEAPPASDPAERVPDYANPTEGFPVFPNLWDDHEKAPHELLLPTTAPASTPLVSAVDVDRVFGAYRKLVGGKVLKVFVRGDEDSRELHVERLTRRPLEPRSPTAQAIAKPNEAAAAPTVNTPSDLVGSSNAVEQSPASKNCEQNGSVRTYLVRRKVRKESAPKARAEWCVPVPRKLVDYPSTDEDDDDDEEEATAIARPMAGHRDLSQAELLEMFSTTQLRVRLKRLRAADLGNLRQPCIMLKRLSTQALLALNEAKRPPEGDTAISTETASEAVKARRKTRAKVTQEYDHLLSSSDSEEYTQRQPKRSKSRAGHPAKGLGYVSQIMGPCSRIFGMHESIAAKSARYCGMAADLWKPSPASGLSNIITKYGPVIAAPAPEMVSDPLSVEEDSQL